MTENEAFTRFQKFRRSIGLGGRKKRHQHNRAEDANETNSKNVVYIITPDQANKYLKNIRTVSKDLSKEITKIQKKDKRSRELQIDGDHLRDLQKHYEEFQKCFNVVDTDVGYARRNNRNDDDDGGFGPKRLRTAPASRHASADVHNPDYEPMADYTLSVNNRNKERSQDTSQQFTRSLSERKPKNVDHRLQEELKVREQANERLQDKIQKLNEQLDEFKRKLQKESEQRESAQNRLSELMGRQLKSNNPAITDLSDPDRPLILVEKFSNLYDNEWTDIIGDIEQITKNEREATTILLTVVTDTYTECYNLRHNSDMFLKLENRSAAVQCKIPQVPEECSVLLKSLSETHIAGLRDAILQKQESVVNRHILQCLAQSRKQYLNKCLELCWMMVCNSPPVQLEWNYKGHSFDSSVLKPFTETGDMVEFMVWPVMFLHKGGPLLCKGVAQGAHRSQQTQL